MECEVKMVSRTKRAGVTKVEAAPAAKPDQSAEKRWRSLSDGLLDRLPLPFAVKVMIVAGIVIGEQVLEQSLAGPQVGATVMSTVVVRLAVPTLVVYMLLMDRFMKRRVVRALVHLRPYVMVDDREYETMARRMVTLPAAVDIGLALLSFVLILALFVLMDSPPPIGGELSMPSDRLAAGYIVSAWAIFGWLGLGLIYTGIQHAAGLGRLARKPLRVNLYDPENLLPFGNISLLHSLVLAGVIVIPILMLGQPSSVASFTLIILNTLGSLMVLILPLVGVYRQMRGAKIGTLNLISNELMSAQEALTKVRRVQAESVADLNARTSALVMLRKTILESPNWPFRSTTAVVRAVVAAMSPLIYFVLIEITRAYLVPVLIR